MKLFSCLMILLLCRLMFCYENLSRRRTTRLTQSSTYDGRNASVGNDGNTATYFCDCAHTDFKKKKAWFQVDLGNSFSIQTVKIYFRKDPKWPQYRARQFYLDVSDLPATQTFTAQRTRCFTDYTTAPNFPSNIQTIPCNQKARYVIVETTYDPPDDGDTGAVLEICEIEVYEGCKNGLYGYFCNNICSGCLGKCHRDKGECEGSCPVGKFCTRCDQTCNQYCQGQCNKTTRVCISFVNGWFGRYCGNVCFGCSTGCDKITGECEGSCPVGKFGTRCEESCSQTCQNGCEKISGVCTSCIEGRYGDFCAEICGAGCVSGCDQFNGNCLCKPGWKGNRCIGCDATHFGAGCSLECSVNCIQQMCNNITGSCTQGCKNGFYGYFCNNFCSGCLGRCHRGTGECEGACPAGKFGTRCDQTCNQNCQGQCDRTTGVCISCVSGRFGRYCGNVCSGCSTRCDKDNGECEGSCPVGKFGTRCEESCSQTCQNGCEKISGFCTSCIEGRYGKSCKELCGGGCDFGCDRLSGHCACKPGWEANNCKRCDATHYGADCSFECSVNCINQNCNNITGSCTQGCKTGYYGDFCNNICCGCLEGCHRDTGACVGACPVGKFGTHCEETCSKTCEGGCTKPSGVCTSCMDGWYGDTCEEICGAGCSLRCDQVDGNCTCKPGWEGYGCRECSPYFYGESCEKPCSKNCDQGLCFANNGSCIKGLRLQNPQKESTQYLVYVFAGLLIISVCLNTYLIMRRAKRCKQETQESKNIASSPDEPIELADLNPVVVETEEQDAVYEALAETNDVCEMSHYEGLPSMSQSKNMENNPIYANN